MVNPSDGQSRKPRVAEFFAGIGLVRMGLEEAGFEVVFANDVDAKKREMYALNFGGAEFALADIRSIRGSDVPDVDLATASFPCTDLSLAGGRAGLRGKESGLVGEFLRVLREMGERRPAAVMIENVPAFGSSNEGADLRDTLAELNELGYTCDAALLDARRFVPQSRPRLFVIGALEPPGESLARPRRADAPPALAVARCGGGRLAADVLAPGPRATGGSGDVIGRRGRGVAARAHRLVGRGASGGVSHQPQPDKHSASDGPPRVGPTRPCDSVPEDARRQVGLGDSRGPHQRVFADDARRIEQAGGRRGRRGKPASQVDDG